MAFSLWRFDYGVLISVFSSLLSYLILWEDRWHGKKRRGIH